MISTVRRNFILSTHTKWITDCLFLILSESLDQEACLPTILYAMMKLPAQSRRCLSGMPWHLVAVKIYTYIADCSIISLQPGTCTLYTLIPADAALRRNDTSAAWRKPIFGIWYSFFLLWIFTSYPPYSVLGPLLALSWVISWHLEQSIVLSNAVHQK